MDIERRPFSEVPEFRSEGTKLVASGVAMRYGARSKPIGGKFREIFDPGAFAKTLADGVDVRSHNEHGGPYLARTSNGTLRLIDGRSELAYEIDLPETTAGRDAAALLERGDVRGSSIGFVSPRKTERWTVDTDGMAMRSVSTARLFRVDLTVEPAYDDSTASLALRSLADEWQMDVRSLLEAADRGELPTLIASPPGAAEPEHSDEPAAPPAPVARPRIGWLYT